MDMPFPGMDPYLEHPMLWPGFHVQMMVALANQLQPRIEPRYIASLEERVYIDIPQRRFIPDVLIKKTREPSAPLAIVQPMADTPLLLEVDPLQVRETRVEILDLYQGKKLVALIEVVSPANKARGPGRRSYRSKQRDILKRDCHLVEIDLLRRGRHVLAIPQRRVAEAKPYEYLASVSRHPWRQVFELYPRRLRERLPRLRIPLAEPDPDVTLDVQAAVEKVYGEGRYMRLVRYEEPCEPRLAPEDQEWANQRWAEYRKAHPELFPG